MRLTTTRSGQEMKFHIKLSKSIAELESDQVQYIWEPPDIYEDIHNNDVWLIYGRKGAGKSTVVEYLGRENATPNVLIVRPSKTKFFSKIITAISESKNEDRIVEQAIYEALDFSLTAYLLNELVPVGGPLLPGSPRERIYKFLTANKLGGNSTLNRTITFISKAAGRSFKLIPNLASALEKEIAEISLEDVKEAFCDYLVAEGKTFVLCIDDIDEIGFSFSRPDRLFINALKVFMVKTNLYYVDKRVKGRVLLTSPSELFFQSTLWGSDWISSKSKCLIWSSIPALQDLVNKRIAVELNIRKKNPRYSGDKYSVATNQTWRRIFPLTIRNKRGKLEAAFEYLVRHTFYTPRHVLDLCDAVLHEAEKISTRSDPTSEALLPEWSTVFQDSVANFARRAENDIRSMFSLIFDNLYETFKEFIGRPHIWNRNQLMMFATERKMKIIRKHDKRQYVGEDLIFELQQLGFLGLGTRSLDPSPPSLESYSVFYSFLEEYPSRKAWEIAVIAPVFYDAYDIRAIDDVVVKPHEKLHLTMATVRKLSGYDPVLHTFPNA